MVGSPIDVTKLIQVWHQSEDKALNELLPLVQQELRRWTPRSRLGGRQGHIPQTTTALVNEAYLRLLSSQEVDRQSRAHLLGVSAQLMRRILVDFARARNYQKRGGGAEKIPLDEASIQVEERERDLLCLGDALSLLQTIDPRKGKVVELRFFCRPQCGRNRKSSGLPGNGPSRLETRENVAISRDGGAWQ